MELIENVVKSQNKLGEGPLWGVAEQTLYWLDIHQNQVERYQPEKGLHQTTTLDLAITVLGLREQGGFVFASNRGFGFWDGSSRSYDLVGNPEDDKPYHRFNDGSVDPLGRFWAGTMYEGPEVDEVPEGRLYRLDSNHRIKLMETGLTISNGIDWSPDQRTMYLTDTLRRTIYAYEFDPASGGIANRRVFIQAKQTDGFPDGLTVDSQGFIWSAFWGGWKVCRFDPQGNLERTLHMPVEYPTCMAFGGMDLNDLYITSAWTALSEEQRHAQPEAGDLFRIRLDISGLPAYRFKSDDTTKQGTRL
jgi:sugar lactone lactonase YvrE